MSIIQHFPLAVIQHFLKGKKRKKLVETTREIQRTLRCIAKAPTENAVEGLLRLLKLMNKLNNIRMLNLQAMKGGSI